MKLSFFIAVCFCVFAQPLSAQDSVNMMANPQVKSAFPGGDAALLCYLDTTLRAEIVSNPAVKGYVFLRYQVDTEGRIIDLNIMKHSTPEVDSEIVRVFRAMPLWTPASHNGKPVYHYQSSSFKIPYQRKLCGLPPAKK